METPKTSILKSSSVDNIPSSAVASKPRLDDAKASVVNTDNVECSIQLTMNSSPWRCIGSSFEELKQQAVDNVDTGYEDRTWYKAALICSDDGCRIPDMDTLRRYIEEGHKLFFFVGTHAPTSEELSLDIARVAELYDELMHQSDDLEESVRLWPPYRRIELEAIYLAETNLLAPKLRMDPKVLSTCQRKIWQYASAVEAESQASSSETDADSSF